MAIENTPFLRNTLIADAVTSTGAAALTVFGAGFLAPLLALPEGLIFWAGVVLVPFVVLLMAAARRPAVPRAWLREIVLINTLWVAASFGILLSGLVAPNWLGVAFVTAQALAVALFTALQVSALRAAQPEAA